METQKDKLLNLHEVLTEASQTGLPEEETKPFSVRMPESLKHDAGAICARHGVTLGKYLRLCTERLVAEYKPE